MTQHFQIVRVDERYSRLRIGFLLIVSTSLAFWVLIILAVVRVA